MPAEAPAARPAGPTVRVSDRAIPPIRWTSRPRDGRRPYVEFRGRYQLPADPARSSLLPGPVTIDWPEQDVAGRAVDLPTPAGDARALLRVESVWTAPIAGRPASVPEWIDRWPRLFRGSLPTALADLPAPVVQPRVLSRNETAVLVLTDVGLSSRVLEISIECWSRHQPSRAPVVPVGRGRQKRLRQGLHQRSPQLWTQTGDEAPCPAPSLATAYGTRDYFHATATPYAKASTASPSDLTVYAAWPALDLGPVALQIAP